MRIPATLGFAVFLALSTPGWAQQYVRPFEVVAQEYFAKLLKREYSTIDLDALEAITKNLTTDDGQPKLSAIYGGITGCLTSGCITRIPDKMWQTRLALIKEWKKQIPRSITAEVAHSKFYLEYAYFIRGQGSSNSVQKEAWPLFHKNLKTALELAQKSSPAAKKDPQWHATMLNIGTAQAWPPERFILAYQEAKKIARLYIPIYFAASSYFSPRWHGTPDTLRKFVEDAVTSTHAELGQSLYARLNWSLWTQTMFVDGQTDWNRMKSGFVRITTDYPHPWNINNFGKFACLAKDAKTMLELEKKIRGKLIPAAWFNSVNLYSQCILEAAKAIRPAQPAT